MIKQDANGNWVLYDDAGNPVDEMAPGVDTGLARSDDNSTSQEGAEAVNASAVTIEVYNAIASFGDRGCIGDDLKELLPHIEYQTISPRYIQMVRRGMIEVLDETRRGHLHNCNQVVRRALPRPWKPVSVAKKQQPADDPRITQARDIVMSMRNSMTLMCSEDRARINFQVSRLEAVLNG
jgi:hypothetical protein